MYKVGYTLIVSIILSVGLFSTDGCTFSSDPAFSIVTDQKLNAPAEYGLAKLISVLKEKNLSFEKAGSIEEAKGETILVIGLAYGNGKASQLLKAGNQEVPKVSEALTIWKANSQNKPLWVISGFDDRGLMYALLDMADRIAWSKDPENPMSEVKTITESPYTGNRAISMYTMNRNYWESRFYDEDHWASYMDMLAKNRFNTLVLIFGYENAGFLAPCYPYFFDVEGFPEIGMKGMTTEVQQRNLAALNRMIAMAHERGLDFKVAIWDHIYRGGVQRGGIPEAELAKLPITSRVQGLTADNLRAYTKAALAEFIRLVPDLDGIQFRMHNESGLKRDEMKGFWAEVFQMMKTNAPHLRLDLRAKELPDDIIQSAIEIGVDFTITTKYWMEQMGLPFHPTHINRQNQLDRRHGYADMLRYPRQYKMHWRMWSGGTQRILLWGDPEYARRFVESTHLYEGDGYEINEPLATKMEAQPHDEAPFELLQPRHQYYKYEFERYWHFFQVFGRMGYNPNTSSAVWDHEFEKRFGPEAGPLVKAALHQASWILPRIVASCNPYSKFPTTRGWPEKQRYGDLPGYARGGGSDIQQFASFDEEAQMLIQGGEMAKLLPSSTSQWFAQTSEKLDQLIAQAEARINTDQNKEFNATITDLKILSNLALYHARRIPAAVSYRLYDRTKDPLALDDAIAYEGEAIEAWRKIVASAGDVYAPDLKMGVREAGFMDLTHRLTGHWKDELLLLEKGLEELEKQRIGLKAESGKKAAPKYKEAKNVAFTELFQISHQAMRNAAAGQPISISIQVSAPEGVKWVRLRFRGVNQHLDYQTLPMEAKGEKDLYQVIVPPELIDSQWDFMYFIEVMDNQGNGRIYPDFNRETPYIVVKLERLKS